MVDFSGVAVGDLDVRWIHGEADDPPIQTHRYDEHTYVLRQSTSMDRLLDFARARPVTHVLGCHIEMSRTRDRASTSSTTSSSTTHRRPGHDRVPLTAGSGWLNRLTGGYTIE